MLILAADWSQRKACNRAKLAPVAEAYVWRYAHMQWHALYGA